MLSRLLRGLLAAAAGVVILMAIAVAGFRLTMARLPRYQAELKAWVDDSLGLRLDFDKMDARWGLRGPELTFRDVSVTAAGESQPFLVSDQASVVIDPWTALAERRLRIGRLTFDGTRLTLIRERDGALHLLGGPAGAEARPDLALVIPPSVEIGVSDSLVVYVDRGSGVAWTFHGVDADLTRGGDVLQLDASAQPPPELGARFEFAAQSEFRSLDDLGRNWRLFADLRGVDLGVLKRALPAFAEAPTQGKGDVGLWLEWTAGRLKHVMLETAVDDLGWGGRRAVGDYSHVALSAEWLRNADGWRLMLNDIDLQRDGRTWPRGTDAVVDVTQGPDGAPKIIARGDFLRLEDLAPLIRVLPATPLTRRWLELDPRGELSAMSLSVARRQDAWDYSVSGSFDRLGADAVGAWPGFDGLSGQLRADSDSGRVSFATHDADLDWLRLFRDRIDVDQLAGIVVWRKGFDGIRLVSDDLLLANSDGTARSNLELTLPAGGGSPELDMETRVGAFDVVAAKRYLPAHTMPAPVVRWLDQALVAGRVTQADVSFVGPLAAFPFDGGEGRFHASASIAGGVLEYASDWPRAVALDGKIEFTNAGFAARAKGRVLRNAGRDVRVDIPDLRKPLLKLHADTDGPLADVLAFLQSAPPIAERLGPGYERLRAPAGRGAVTLDLDLPLHDLPAYTLRADLGLENGTLAVDGFEPRATELVGTLKLADGALRGQGIRGIFLDGPITADLAAPPPGAGAYRAALDFRGEVTAASVAAAFHLPFAQFVAGQTGWQGRLLIPSQPASGVSDPLKISVSSNLAGVALNFPPPFAKAPAEPVNLGLEIELPDTDRMSVVGHLGATRRFAVSLVDAGGGRQLTAGALRFGGGEPEPQSRGFTVAGNLASLDFDAWLGVLGASASGASLADASIGSLFRQASLEVDDFRAFGQRLGKSRLNVHAADPDWLIDIESPGVAGRISVPRDLTTRPQIVAHMQRLYIEPGSGGGGGGPGASVDPRKLVGLTLDADAFGFGSRRFGAVHADVRPAPRGLKLVSFKSHDGALSVDGSGDWLDGPDGAATRLSLKLQSTDVAAALADLSLDPVAAGDKAEVTADVEWPGAPSADWMQHVAGRVSLHFENGSLLDIDPGAGRVVGLMSITALPRRLALDFRDVFNKGLVFDDIAGDFELVDGNAYTDNLKVSGPAAEIGVAGRVGLRDRDYSQQAVVAAEPGKVLPTVGGLIGGPGVGAALLIFTRIFKEPLKGIGRASYCVTGSWDAPKVERLSSEQVQQGRVCAELPPGGLAHAAEASRGGRARSPVRVGEEPQAAPAPAPDAGRREREN